MLLLLALFLTAAAVELPLPITRQQENPGIGPSTAVPPASLPGLEWHTANGKTADPCATEDQLYSVRPDCLSNELPDEAVTILLPVNGIFYDQSGTATTPPASLTIVGRNLPLAGYFALSSSGSCATVDTGNFGELQGTGTVDGTQLTFPLTFTAGREWWKQSMEYEPEPRKLCFAISAVTGSNAYFYTGFKIGVVWPCSTANNARSCANLPSASADLTEVEQRLRSLKTMCCVHNTFGVQPTAFSVGQCVNPSVQACCQGAALDIGRARCCDARYETVVNYNRPCPCKVKAANCPTGETCCTFSKYPELSLLVTDAPWPQYSGECYNNLTHQCCDTGHRFDPGTHRCCNITGIQSRNVPCPCNVDDDCQGGTTPNGLLFGMDGTQFCCTQDMPFTYETLDAYVPLPTGVAGVARCSKYSNYPIGQSPQQVQKCLGTCMDNRYQMCCNGVVCHREFDKCCNSTCCNKFVGTCTPAVRPGTPNNMFNWNEFAIGYEVCTTVEQLTAPRSFWIFVLPVYLLVATLLSIAVVIAYINRSSRRNYSMVERFQMLLSFVIMLLAFPCYFAPIYKYGVWVIWVSLITVICAAARVRWVNILVVILQLITLGYLFDPFNGNNYFNFASLRNDAGAIDPDSAGVLYAIHRMSSKVDTCVKYYDFFTHDVQIQDPRWENMQVTTFGYCSRGWVMALHIFEGIVLLLTLVQFPLSMIALILRYKEERSFEPIELEVRGVEEAPMPVY